MPEINGITVPFIPIAEINRKPSVPIEQKTGTGSFDTIFTEEISKLKISGHAQSRMVSRNINLTDFDMMRLDAAIDRAAVKNAKDSLVILDDKAFVVNVPNKTVVTMLEQQQMTDNVITKIDSAVFA